MNKNEFIINTTKEIYIEMIKQDDDPHNNIIVDDFRDRMCDDALVLAESLYDCLKIYFKQNNDGADSYETIEANKLSPKARELLKKMSQLEQSEIKKIYFQLVKAGVEL